MAPVRNMKYIYDDPQWKKLPSDVTDAKRFTPNRVYQNTRDREVGVISRRSRLGGHSINVEVLEYYSRALEEGRVVQAWIILEDEHGRYLAADTFLNVARRLQGKEPNPSDRGWSPYHWIDGDFQHSPLNGFNASINEYNML